MKKVLIFGITIFGIVYLLFGLSSKLTILAMLFGLYALYAASTEGISRAWISNLASKEKTATAIGLFNTLQSIATLVASSLAGLIWFKFGATPVFIISGTVALGVALYLTVFIKEYK